MQDVSGPDEEKTRTRPQVESYATQESAADVTGLSTADMARLISELRLNQMKLEQQYEELRLTQNELAETRDRYASLYDFAPIGYFTLDAKACIIEVNLKGATMLGRQRPRLLGKPFVVYVARQDHDAFHDYITRILETGRAETREFRLNRQRSTRFYAELSGQAEGNAPGPKGTMTIVRVMARDVTDRHEADEALRQANHIIENSPAVLIRYPLIGGVPGPADYVSANIDRFGFSREDILSGAVLPPDLVHPDDRPRVESTFRQNAVSGHDDFAVDHRLMTKDGRIRFVTDRIQLRREPDGRIRAVQGIILDVTESVQARQDLETVLDSAPIPIVKVRIAADGQRILDYQNPAAVRLFGPQATGMSCRGLLCKKDACPALRAKSGIVRERECAIKTLAGERIMYKTARKLPDAPYIIEAMVDVTELMRTRERLTHAMEAAEAANKAKSEFLATMSHEIRTPMNGLMGMTELALGTDLTGEQREYLDLARQSALSLLEIINDILDFSRIEAGKMELARDGFSLRKSMATCLRLFDNLAARQNNTLTMTLAPNVPDLLIGDAGRLAQIVGNLVSNGLKFSKNGSVHVAVETSPTVLCALELKRENDVTLLFSVTDTGIGIARDKQHRIFDYFTQLDARLNRGAGGTGLGLSISKNLVSLMGGRIWVESEPGQGSTFFFTAVFDLPQHAQTGKTAVLPHDAPMPSLPAMRILLVEDNCINQLVGKRLLERRGHSVTAVDSGRTALEVLKNKPFHCILMDVEMPDLNGLETLARLRDASVFGETATTPVVALTAHAIKGYREHLLALGFDGYVSKPIDMRELDDALRQAVARDARDVGDTTGRT